MVLEKRETLAVFGRKDTFKIPGSVNKLICERGKYYIAGPDGKALSQVYNKISEFVDGKAVFWDDVSSGVINADGKVISKRKYDRVSLDGDIIRICKNDKWGFANFEGKVLCSPKYTFLEKFSNGLTRIRTDEDLWGVINDKGRVIIEPKYRYLGNPAAKQIVAQNIWGFGVIDIKENTIEPFKYKRISSDENQTIIYNTDGTRRTEQYAVCV